MKTMTENLDPHFIGGVLITLLLAGTGHTLEEITNFIPVDGFLHGIVAITKVLSYLGSGLVGITTFGKWIHSLIIKWRKHGHK